MVSFFTDAASEMLYPILPVYLNSLGFSVFYIGMLEGVAEAFVGLSKGYFGKLSDLSGRRVPFVRAGYIISAVSKPLLAVFTYPMWILFCRTADRLGKGIRAGARDAVLSSEGTRKTRGTVFGFHRSMDTLGAVLGPLLALWFLQVNPGQYKSLFLLAFIPGAAAILSLFFLKEKSEKQARERVSTGFFSFLTYWKNSSKQYRQLAGALVMFTLFNSSDLFLILKVKEAGFDDSFLITIYIFYNLVYALFAWPAGYLADRFGLKKVFLFGLLLFASCYFGMALATEAYSFFIIFFVYGMYAATTEGVGKAWLVNVIGNAETGTALGSLAAAQSISAMMASTLTGFFWWQAGPKFAFAVSAIAALAIFFYLLKVIPSIDKKSS
jgi:MFS family permease